MHRQWFGDAYTYAHRALIHGIASPGEWFVHPIVNGGDMLGHWGGVKLYHLVCSCPPKKSELTG